MYVSEHRRRINLEPDQLRESLAKLQEEQTRNLHSLYEFRDTIYLKDGPLAHVNQAILLSKRVINALGRSINEVDE